jgi:hypothetical protein
MNQPALKEFSPASLSHLQLCLYDIFSSQLKLNSYKNHTSSNSICTMFTHATIQFEQKIRQLYKFHALSSYKSICSICNTRLVSPQKSQSKFQRYKTKSQVHHHVAPRLQWSSIRPMLVHVCWPVAARSYTPGRPHPIRPVGGWWAGSSAPGKPHHPASLCQRHSSGGMSIRHYRNKITFHRVFDRGGNLKVSLNGECHRTITKSEKLRHSPFSFLINLLM